MRSKSGALRLVLAVFAVGWSFGVELHPAAAQDGSGTADACLLLTNADVELCRAPATVPTSCTPSRRIGIRTPSGCWSCPLGGHTLGREVLARLDNTMVADHALRDARALAALLGDPAAP